LELDYGKNLDSIIAKKDKSIFFALSESLLEKDSSSLVVIIGMLGMSFLGAIINSYRKNAKAGLRIKIISDNLFTILLISISSSLITYLSLQGGVTLITLGSDAKLNPYLILCVCFAAAVYSEEIWQKVKNWLG
jgi:hypothetical protein